MRSADGTRRSELEEERRLFYVALTRARDEVLLTAAAYRRRFDGAWGAQVSRFVEEIPPELLRGEGAAARSRVHTFAFARASGRGAGGRSPRMKSAGRAAAPTCATSSATSRSISTKRPAVLRTA